MGKKSKNAPSTTGSTSTATEANDNNNTSTTDRLSEQLNDVMVQVVHNIMKMDVLHQQWMNYLFVLSFIVVIISIYQIYNNFNTNQNYIDMTDDSSRNHQLLLFIRKLPKPMQLLLHIDYSIITHIISTCMSILLFRFIMDVKQKLQDQQPLSNPLTKIFRHYYFRMTQFCFLPTLLSYYYYYDHSKNNQNHPSIPTSSSPSSLSITQQQPFPIVIIYFVIATGCIWFMQHQSYRMYRSYYSIVRLRSEFMQKQQEQQQQQEKLSDNNDQRKNSGGKKKK